MADDRNIIITLEITRLEYNDATRPQHVELYLTTEKHYNGGIVSKATAYWVGLHSRSHSFELCGPGGDFSVTLEKTARTVRATQKTIDTQHARVFTPEAITQITNDAKQYYAGRAA